MGVRSEAVTLAKAMGLCTQCFKYPHMLGRLQCERCITTNRNKQIKRRCKVDEVTGQQMCSRCQVTPAVKDKTKCEPCLQQDRDAWRKKYYRSKKKRVLSQAHKDAIAEGRKNAFAKKDKGEKRPYKRRVEVADVQMQGMVNELEMFIGKLPNMTAQTYLEARVNLIKNILLRGK